MTDEPIPHWPGELVTVHGNQRVLPRTGHLAHMERPAQVAAEIDAATVNVREFPLAPAG